MLHADNMARAGDLVTPSKNGTLKRKFVFSKNIRERNRYTGGTV